MCTLSLGYIAQRRICVADKATTEYIPSHPFPQRGREGVLSYWNSWTAHAQWGRRGVFSPLMFYLLPWDKNVSLLEIDLKVYQEILKRKSCKELTAVTSFIMSYIVLLQFNNSWRYYAGLRHKFPVVVSCSVLRSGSWSQTFYKQLL